MKKNRDWEKPELTVLVRNKPEEAVLEACKTSTGGGPMQTIAAGEGSVSDYCQYSDPETLYCATDVAS